MVRFSFYPIGNSYLLVAIVALVLLALLVLVPAGGRTSGRRRWVLHAIRLAVIGLVLFGMLRPTMVYTDIRMQSATLVILADKSRSMTVPDSIGGKSRWAAMTKALDDARDALGTLATDFEVKAYTFDAQIQPVKITDGQLELGDSPDGDQTAIGSSIEDALRGEAGKRLLGVVLLSDGAQRAYAPRDLAPQTAAFRMKRLGYPLFTVPFGQARGLGQAQDVAVENMLSDQSVFVKNELAVTGQVRVDGYANRDIPIRLLFETPSGKMEVVDEVMLKTASSDDQLLPFKLTYVPEVAGEFKLMVDVPNLPGELGTTNNRLSTFVNVLKGGLRVLYLEGTLRVEQRFIRRSIGASPDVKVDYVRIDPVRSETRPKDLSDRFKPGKYDVFILGDVDSTAFKESELKNLADTVSKGAGLIMLGGFQSFGPGGFSGTPMRDVLPVGMDRFGRQTLGEPIRSDLHLAGPLKMRPNQFGLNHFALMLAGGKEENLRAWNRLPPLEGANRFLEIKPNAIVLAVDQEDRPLMVSSQYGDGRVLAFAGDSTWHWWMRGFETSHKRFWRQIILWLARKDSVMEGDVWVKLPRLRFSPGQRVEFSVGAQLPSGEPADDAQFRANVVLPDGTKRPVRLVRKNKQVVGSFRNVKTTGDYAIEVSATHAGKPLGTTRARFLVFERDLELGNASGDVTVMESLAVMTDGQSLPPEQLSDLVERLSESTEDLEIRKETKRTFFDSWYFFLVFVTLLGAEWFLRKRWGLV